MVPVLFEELACPGDWKIGRVTLNAERSLNSLTLEMVDLIGPQLKRWEDDDSIVLVLIEGAGDRAFCAGADLSALYVAMLENPGGPVPIAEAFFEREYRMDFHLHQFSKPTLAWGSGVLMGGGLGIVGACSHRVGTETSRIAFPEITIGLFPDVGASYFFARMPFHLAAFIGLTGCQFPATDAVEVGLLDYVLSSKEKPNLVQQLTTTHWTQNPHAQLDRLLGSMAMAEGLPPSNFDQYGDRIQSLTGESADGLVERFLAGATGDARDEWLQSGIENFLRGCPTTAAIVEEQLRRGPGMSLAEVYAMELNVAVNCTRRADLAEGIRALLIDKDRKPAWQVHHPVPNDWLGAHFESPFESGNPLISGAKSLPL